MKVQNCWRLIRFEAGLVSLLAFLCVFIGFVLLNVKTSMGIAFFIAAIGAIGMFVLLVDKLTQSPNGYDCRHI